MGRPKLYDETLRDRILDEARKMLTESGYHSVSLRTLTKNAETSTNAVYTLFGSKEALMAEVIVQNMERKLRAANERDPANDPLAELAYIAHYYRRLALDTPKVFAGAISAMNDARSSTSTPERTVSGILSVDDKVFAPILRACQRFVDLDLVACDDANEMGLAAWSTIHGLIALEVSGMLGRRTEDINHLVIKALYALYLGWKSPTINSLPISLAKHYDALLDMEIDVESGSGLRRR